MIRFSTNTAARDLLRTKRMIVIGSGGSGKSTLAARLGEILGIRVIHLDSLYWKPGWREEPRSEWEETVRSQVRGETWIMDGNYGGTLDIRLAAAEAVIFLDLPRILCIRRVVARRFRYAHESRPDMAPGCQERLDLGFLKYLWKYPAERRPGILRKLEQASREKTVISLRSPEEVRGFVVDLEGLVE